MLGKSSKSLLLSVLCSGLLAAPAGAATQWSQPITLPGQAIDTAHDCVLALCADNPGPAQLSFDAEGNLNALYQLSDKVGSADWEARLEYYHQLNYAQLKAGQSSFSEKQLISNPEQQSYEPQLITKDNGQSVLTWGEEEPDGSGGQHMYRQVNADGQLLGDIFPLAPASGLTAYPQMKINPQGAVVAMWRQATSKPVDPDGVDTLVTRTQEAESEKFAKAQATGQIDRSKIETVNLQQKPDRSLMVSTRPGDSTNQVFYGLLGGELLSPSLPGRPEIYPTGNNKLTATWMELKTQRRKGHSIKRRYLYTGELEWGTSQINNRQLLSKNFTYSQSEQGPDGSLITTWTSGEFKTENFYAAVKPAGSGRFSRPQKLAVAKFKDDVGIEEIHISIGRDGKALMVWHQGGRYRFNLQAAVKPAGNTKFEKPQKIASLTRPLWDDGAEQWAFNLDIPNPVVGPEGQLALSYKQNQGGDLPRARYQYKLVTSK